MDAAKLEYNVLLAGGYGVNKPDSMAQEKEGNSLSSRYSPLPADQENVRIPSEPEPSEQSLVVSIKLSDRIVVSANPVCETGVKRKIDKVSFFPAVCPSLPKSSSRVTLRSRIKPDDVLIQADRESRTYGEGLKVAENHLGIRGLYADRDFPAHYFITKVEGERRQANTQQLNQLMADPETNTHIMTVCRDEIILGLQNPEVGKGAGSLVNDGSLTYLSSCNAEFISIDGKEIYVKSLRCIRAGEEITAKYGQEYWSMLRKFAPEQYKVVQDIQIPTKEGFTDILKLVKRIQPGSAFKRIYSALEGKMLPVGFSGMKPEVLIKGWTVGLVEYLAYKHDSANYPLTVRAVQLFEVESPEYFDLVQSYITERGNIGTSLACYMNESLPFATGGIFLPSDQWRNSHLDYIWWTKKNTPLSEVSLNKVTYVLKVLDPTTQAYSEMLVSYLKKAFDDCISGNTVNATHTKISIVTRGINRNHLTIPREVNGKVLVHKSWYKDAVMDILRCAGFDVVAHGQGHKSDGFYKNLKIAAENDETSYYRLLHSVCSSNSFNYSNMAGNTLHNRRPLPLPHKDWSPARFDPKYPKASWFAIDALGNGIDEPMLRHMATPSLTAALTLIPEKTSRGKALRKQILEILANSYEDTKMMCRALNKRKIPAPAGKDKWTRSLVNDLKMKSQFKVPDRQWEKIANKRWPKENEPESEELSESEGFSEEESDNEQ